jgi:hypothetical protein
MSIDNTKTQAKRKSKPKDAKVERIQYIRNACPMKVALDYSYKSPGIAIFDGTEIFLYYIPQLKRQENLSFALVSSLNPEVSLKVTALPRPAKKVAPVKRNHDLAVLVLELIEHHRILAEWEKSQVHVAIEGYAFNKFGFSSISHLYESGGVLRNHLYAADYRIVDEIPPTCIKQSFTGKGNSNKRAMLRNFTEKWGFPDPNPALHFPNIVADDGEDVPKPTEDLVDAFAILSSISTRLRNVQTFRNDDYSLANANVTEENIRNVGEVHHAKHPSRSKRRKRNLDDEEITDMPKKKRNKK